MHAVYREDHSAASSAAVVVSSIASINSIGWILVKGSLRVARSGSFGVGGLAAAPAAVWPGEVYPLPVNPDELSGLGSKPDRITSELIHSDRTLIIGLSRFLKVTENQLLRGIRAGKVRKPNCA